MIKNDVGTSRLLMMIKARLCLAVPDEMALPSIGRSYAGASSSRVQQLISVVWRMITMKSVVEKFGKFTFSGLSTVRGWECGKKLAGRVDLGGFVTRSHFAELFIMRNR